MNGQPYSNWMNHVLFIMTLRALGTQTSSLGTARNHISRSKNLCKGLYLHPHQRGVCMNYTGLITSVGEGVRMSIDECQEQFKNRKWNCSVKEEGKSVFGTMIRTASRESAFISAITSAGVAYAVTEACAEGKSLHCRCDRTLHGKTEEGWEWGGCNRPISFGIWFSTFFIDDWEKKTRGRRDPRLHMNLHNNRAGRALIRHNVWTKCKCHGMSGNCNMKTCWLAQPRFSELGRLMKDRYDSAHEMEFRYKTNRQGKRKFRGLIPKYKEYLPPTALDFIYFEDSPDYCEDNKKLGIVGTQGRVCNISSSGVDGCDLMCCRRGYSYRMVVETKSCDCKFIWCCKVTCKKCTDVVPRYTCK